MNTSHDSAAGPETSHAPCRAAAGTMPPYVRTPNAKTAQLSLSLSLFNVSLIRFRLLLLLLLLLCPRFFAAAEPGAHHQLQGARHSAPRERAHRPPVHEGMCACLRGDVLSPQLFSSPTLPNPSLCLSMPLFGLFCLSLNAHPATHVVPMQPTQHAAVLGYCFRSFATASFSTAHDCCSRAAQLR